jgi:hypothetical protein
MTLLAKISSKSLLCSEAQSMVSSQSSASSNMSPWAWELQKETPLLEAPTKQVHEETIKGL